ncbi:serine/threonine-protein kinase [Streptomyces sp. CB01580]|uniref:serine/threonine-protein kinase n=1 Tax=Streptomyces sp. CB01580 TaxID=1703933 RepID=UPI0009A0BC44|nr:serine/threonine-protein kinase [Streptomyces sp. CB01580]
MEAGGMLADRYRLLAPIASGAQGTVWRAVDTRHGEDVAVKVTGGADVESLLRLVCEQSVRIGHPHVLAPVDWFVRDGEAWLVLPLVRGGTLAGLLADYGELPPAVGLLLAEQILDALVAVHGAGLVHRDVKPSNILLAATGAARPHAYLGDFGIARVLPHLQLTAPAYVAGTPDYLAPEIRAGAGSSPAQDIYAAGLVLRVLGAPPALLAAMTAERPEHRPTAAAALDAITAARIAHGFEHWPLQWQDEPFLIADQLGEAPLPVTDRSPRRRRLWAALAVGAALLAGLATTAALTSGSPDHPAAPSGSRPPTAPAPAVPADARRGPADPEGPTAFSPCPADREYDVAFSPEGYILMCRHIPDTRRYSWQPTASED